MALPTRARPSFSHHQSLPSGRLHKPLSLLHQRADRRSKKNYSPSVVTTKPHYRKLTRIKKQRVLSQTKGQDKTPYRINSRRNTPRYILIKLTRTKHNERILKAAREKQQVTYKRNPKCLIAEFFSRNSASQKGMVGYI